MPTFLSANTGGVQAHDESDQDTEAMSIEEVLGYLTSLQPPNLQRLKNNIADQMCTLHCANVLLGPQSEIGKTLRPVWSVFICFAYCGALSQLDLVRGVQVDQPFAAQLDAITLIYNIMEQIVTAAVSENDISKKLADMIGAGVNASSGGVMPSLPQGILSTLRALPKYSTDESVRVKQGKRLLHGITTLTGPRFITMFAEAVGIPKEREPETPMGRVRMETKDGANEMATMFARDGGYLVCVVSKDVHLMSMKAKTDITKEKISVFIKNLDSGLAVKYIDDNSPTWATYKKSEKQFPVLFRGYATLFYGTMPNAGA